ncbi:MAG TPA: response regulator [Holophagaceae bacterium]|nr:response regulator [Holophagaceae bacterium]
MTDLKRILLVEDNPNDVELTLAAFEGHHLANEVVVMRDGADALDYLFRRGAFGERLAGNPAVVLLDLKLPKVNGLEVLEAVRAEPSMKTLPIVVLTSSQEEPDLQRCYAMGVNAYVVKPVDFGDFIRAVGNLGVFWALINQPPPGSFPAKG